MTEQTTPGLDSSREASADPLVLARGPSSGERLTGKVAIVVGAGQTPGSSMGNGRATALRFAAEGARVLCVDRDAERAEATAAMIGELGGEALGAAANAVREDECRGLIDLCMSRWGQIDILHNNVGIGAGDSGPTRLTEEVWDRIMAVNLKGVMFACKHVLPIMREQQPRRDHQHLLCGRGVICRDCCLQGVEGCAERLFPISCHRWCEIRHSCQRDRARAHEYADGR